jgi:hypothetical protein
MAESERCCKVMVEAANSVRLHPTSILDVYSEFQHLDMLYEWAYGCTLTLLRLQVWMDFWKIGGVADHE